jgi:hydroxymethylbilane synthase
VKVRIGSRGSALALWQAEHVKSRLEALGHEVSITRIETTGDRSLEGPLEPVGGKGAFLKEIEEALLAEEIDLAVHSLKDVPTALVPALHLPAVLPREDPRDALVSASGAKLAALPEGARVGTTSLRRRAQLLALRSDLRLMDTRGNVDTRLRKLHSGACDAVILAFAGLLRLGRKDQATEILDPEIVLPAPGQGAIALECRASDKAITESVRPLDDPLTASAVAAEREFLSNLGGNCNLPLGALAERTGASWRLRALVASIDGRTMLKGERIGTEPRSLGKDLAKDLLSRGADRLLTL